MTHNLLIALHAAAAVISFIVGVIILLPPAAWRSSSNLDFLSKLFLGTLALMLVLLIGVIVVDWLGLDNIQRLIFSGLTALGVFMVWRAIQADYLLTNRPAGWQPKYTAHIGFDLISLFEGFIIISSIDLGAPVWLVVILALFGVLTGRWLVHLADSRFVRLPH